eukprot:9407890-Ditylum_brightwellii.AAC.1
MDFGHYKAATFNTTVGTIHTLKSYLALNFGIIINQWSQGIQAMIFKDSGNIKILCLQAILLLEAEYN